MVDVQHSQEKEALEDAANRLLTYPGIGQVATLAYTEITDWITHDDGSVTGTNYGNGVKWSANALAAFAMWVAAQQAPPVSPPPPPPSGTGGSPNFKYATGFGIMPPDYADHPSMPAPLASFDDPNTGAAIQRLTDASQFGTSGAAFPSLKIMYSQFAPDSSDGKYVLAEDPNGNLYAADAKTGALVSALHVTENRSPRWDYSGNAPSTLYYTTMTGGQLRARDVATGADTLVHDFADMIAKYAPANGIFMDGHSDTDDQSRLFPIQILCFDPSGGSWYALALALYDRAQDKVVGVIDATNVPTDPADPKHPLGDIHSAPFSLSRDGKYVAVQWSAPATGSPLVDTTRDGAHCYPITFDASGNPTGIDVANGKRVNPSGGAHMCWAYGADGKCYYVAQNTRTDWFEAVDPAVGIGPRAGDTTQDLSIKIVNNVTLGWNCQVHFSAPYRGPLGYVGMLFDAPDDTEPGGNQTYVFALKAGATPLRLGPTYHTNPGTGKSGDNYDDQHYGAFSQDGSRFYWASNWRNDSGQRDVFVLNLPADWQTGIP